MVWTALSNFHFSEDAVKRSGNPNVITKSPKLMEYQIYSKANSKVSEIAIIDVFPSTTDLNWSVYCISLIMYVRFVLHCGVQNINKKRFSFRHCWKFGSWCFQSFVYFSTTFPLLDPATVYKLTRSRHMLLHKLHSYI